MLDILVVAYVLTGIYCIMRDFQKPYSDRPAYARNPSRYLKGFIQVIFVWPCLVVLDLKSRLWWKAGLTLLTFILLVGWGLLVL